MRIEKLLLAATATVLVSGCTPQTSSPSTNEAEKVGDTLHVGMDYDEVRSIAFNHGFQPEPFLGAYQPTPKRNDAFELSLPDDRALIVWHAHDGVTVSAISLIKHATKLQAEREHQDLHHFDLSHKQ
jgi:hypothetical protein